MEKFRCRVSIACTCTSDSSPLLRKECRGGKDSSDAVSFLSLFVPRSHGVAVGFRLLENADRLAAKAREGASRAGNFVDRPAESTSDFSVFTGSCFGPELGLGLGFASRCPNQAPVKPSMSSRASSRRASIVGLTTTVVAAADTEAVVAVAERRDRFRLRARFFLLVTSWPQVIGPGRPPLAVGALGRSQLTRVFPPVELKFSSCRRPPLAAGLLLPSGVLSFSCQPHHPSGRFRPY